MRWRLLIPPINQPMNELLKIKDINVEKPGGLDCETHGRTPWIQYELQTRGVEEVLRRYCFKCFVEAQHKVLGIKDYYEESHE